jgi:hypothetical protein
MRKLLLGSLFLVCLAAPLSAQAGFGVEGSIGKGLTVSPEVNAEPTNLMVAPGISILWLRLQAGLVADLPDVKGRDFDIGVRPMLTLSPPILPLYGRLIFAFNNLLDEELRTVAYGAAVGLSFGLAGVGVFAEAGMLPRSLNDEMVWVLEGRAGISLGF